MKIHYYMLSYRSEALIASHLEPEQFGLYMAVGTQKNTRGNVLFFEIDSSLKSDYFHLADIEKRCTPHKDGRPKASKYISVYRVLEHIDLSYFGPLYLATADGRIMHLEASEYNTAYESEGPNLYQELCPVSPLIVSALAPQAFLRFMTDPGNPVSFPRLFFADMQIDRNPDGSLVGDLPYSDPRHIVDCINELEHGEGKPTKTVSRSPQIHGFFRTIRRGFFLGDHSGMKFFKFPERHELEVEHSHWWHSASESLVS